MDSALGTPGAYLAVQGASVDERICAGGPAAVVRSTPFGPVVVVGSIVSGRPKIIRVLLSRPGQSAEDLMKRAFPLVRSTGIPPEIEALAGDIQAFLSGEDIRFSLSMVSLEMCPGFQQEVLRAEHRIPRGAVSTYADIAGHLGRPCAASAVGNALARNPFPVIIPCHRAIRSDGSLAGFQGGVAMKRRLLEMEGIEFAYNGNVALKSGGVRYRF